MKKFLCLLIVLTLVVSVLSSFAAYTTVGNTVFYNAETDEQIFSLDNVDNLYATTSFTGRYEENASIIVGHYNAEGKLVKIESIIPVESIIGESVEYTTPNISVEGTDIIKVFAWTGTTNIKPILKVPGVISRSVELPTATVSELDVASVPTTPLTFAMNFKANPATNAQLLAYGTWYADFVLTVNKDVTFNADGTKDGYLAGQYDSWSPAWVVVPNKDVTVAAGASVKIMETAAETYGKAGLKYTYQEVYDRVKDFDCGVFFSESFLVANPDLQATLELRIYNPLNEEESYLIGETYRFLVPEESGNVTTEEIVLTAPNVITKIPAGVILDKGVLTKDVQIINTLLTESESDVVVGEDETLSAMDIHVTGVSSNNTTPILITLQGATEKGYNKGNLSLFHVENGVTVEMEEVESYEDLVKHNQFTYEPADGTITLAMATFSEVALLTNNKNGWNGEYDYSWYDASQTEYTISNADQMAAFSTIVGGMLGQTVDSFEGKTVKLMADLNFSGEKIFYPVGYYNTDGHYKKSGVAITSGLRVFEGTFDGNGHTISNIYQNTWDMKGDNEYYSASEQCYRDGMGLFGKVKGATIKNLTVDNFTSDGEYTTTGVIVAYADSAEGRPVIFENIAITNCNPRVYNIGNGGIVGSGGWYSKSNNEVLGNGIEYPNAITFKNITVDNTNKISALWGSWDVACAGIMGRYYPDSKCGVKFENCHVAAQIDVYNDVCGNYQYYWYRYAGMMIGTVQTSTTDEKGYTVPDMTGIAAKDCTVHFGTWNNYYYCELVANSLASYTHDHQFSRLTEVDAVNVDEMTVSVKGVDTAIPTSGRYNYVVVNGTPATENATCYHFVDGKVWNHENAGTEVVDGETVLKEDKQHVYLPFNQLFQGSGWGVKHIPVYNGDDYAFEGITILDREIADSVVKFESVAEESYTTGATVTIGELFQAKDGAEVIIDADNVQVTVSPADENSTVTATYTANTEDWTKGTLTFAGEGSASVTITDYYFCTATTIKVNINSFDVITEVRNNNISLGTKLVDGRIVISCKNKSANEENIAIVVTSKDQTIHIDQADRLPSDEVYYSSFKATSGTTYRIKAKNGHKDVVSLKVVID